jgi:hypothetical protein
VTASHGGHEATPVLHSWENSAAVLEYWESTTAALHLRQEMTTTQSSYRLRFAVEAETLAIEEQCTEPVLVEVPVSHRSGIDMEEFGMRVPADAAALHRTCREHCFGEQRSA